MVERAVKIVASRYAPAVVAPLVRAVTLGAK